MKLDLKLISIIVFIQVITAVLVFTLTRAYYQEDASVVSTSDEPLPSNHSPTSSPIVGGFPGFPDTGKSPATKTSNDPAYVNQQAHDAFNNKDYQAAAKLYQRVIDLAPGNAETYNNLGLTLHYIGRSDEALVVLKKGAGLDPNFQRIWLTLGFVQSGTGNYPNAKRSLQRAIELGPETAQGKSATEMLSKLP